MFLLYNTPQKNKCLNDTFLNNYVNLSKTKENHAHQEIGLKNKMPQYREVPQRLFL